MISGRHTHHLLHVCGITLSRNKNFIWHSYGVNKISVFFPLLLETNVQTMLTRTGWDEVPAVRRKALRSHEG